MRKSTFAVLFIILVVLGSVAGWMFGKWLKKTNAAVSAPLIQSQSSTNLSSQDESEPTEEPDKDIKEEAPEYEGAILPSGEVAPEVIEIGTKAGNVVRTLSKFEPYKGDLADDIQDYIDYHYTQFNVPGLTQTLYGFINENGAVQYRTIGTRWKKENNQNVQELFGVWRAEIERNGNNLIVTVSDAKPIVLSSERYFHYNGTEEMMDTPQNYDLIDADKRIMRVKNQYGENLLRKWVSNGVETVMCPCDSKGFVRDGVFPVNWEEESLNALDQSRSAIEKQQGARTAYPAVIDSETTIEAIGQ